MESYYWEIEIDHISEELKGLNCGNKELKGTEPCSKFEMYDDDDNLYCTGHIWGNFDGFEPKDDYGEGGLGVTRIDIDGEQL